MSWPSNQDYNEAIQNPRLTLDDPELRQGAAATNAIGLPRPFSGNFADVYEFHCPATGNRWAVKCFTRQVKGLRERYQCISDYLFQAKLPFTVPFQFLERGVRIRADWFPVLKMQWVEGLTLNTFVREYLDRPATLEALSRIWIRMSRRLRDARVAHADLQHGNALLVPGSKADALAVKLIDYDGMCVPALLQRKSGEIGHPAYQHPQRLREGTYNQEVDRFPSLVIVTALRCVMAAGAPLWAKYDNGDNLLFRESDLRDPDASALFAELQRIEDPVAEGLVKQLRHACRMPLEACPLVEDLLPDRSSTSTPMPSHSPPPIRRSAASEAIPLKPSERIDWAALAPSPPAAIPVNPGHGNTLAMFANERSETVREPSGAVRRKSSAKMLIAALGGAALLVVALFGVIILANLKPWGSDTGVAKGGEKKLEQAGDKGIPIRPKDDLPDSGVRKSEDSEMPRALPQSVSVDLGDVKMEFVLILKGTFVMGSPNTEKGRNPIELKFDAEEPHEVEITKPFYMAKYPVTQQQYAALIGKNPSGFFKEGSRMSDIKDLDTSQFPVESVSWDDAQEFCKKMHASDNQKRPFRLPKEAEWEYACRAGSTTAFHFGSEENGKGANCDCTAEKGNSLGRTSKVGSYDANNWGLYDMHGNVWQWCEDYYGPIEGLKREDPLRFAKHTEESRILRGGSWSNSASFARAAMRNSHAPGTRIPNFGFRVAFGLEAPAKVSTGDVEADKGLLLRLTFEKDAYETDGKIKTIKDLSPAKRTVVAHGAAYTPEGKKGGGLFLDGKSYLEVSDVGFPQGNQPRTVLLWAKTSESERKMKGNSCLFLFGKENPFSAVYLAFLPARTPGVLFVGNHRVNQQIASSSSIVADTQWHHLALVYDGNNSAALYVDGKVEAVSARHYATELDGSFYVGCSADKTSPFKGWLDEIEVYDRALTVAEIRNRLSD